MSKYKAKLGCKGIGRFTWLKVFDEAKIESFTKTEAINIDFNKNFSASKIETKQIDKGNHTTGTKITFSNVNSRYCNSKKDSRENADLDGIKNAVENHLMIEFFLLKNKNKKFNIKLQIGENSQEIESNTIKQLECKNFSLKDKINNRTDIQFYLYYHFKKDKKDKHEFYYCADGREVLEFPKEIIFNNLPDKSSSVFLLTSKYFDERINNERNDFSFDIKANDPTIDNPVPMPGINDELKKKIDDIITEKYPKLKKRNANVINKCIDENPHLAKYIREQTAQAAHSIFINEETLLEKANSKFKTEKESIKNKFISILEKNDINSDEFKESVFHLNDICNRELAEYFCYRQNIINALKAINNEKNKKEKLLHNLFMPMKTTVDKETESQIYSTNLWLLDDKYMSYTNAFSDK
jgi:hypothetical protein